MSEKYFIQKETLTAIADTIREATGSAEEISFAANSIRQSLQEAIGSGGGVSLPSLGDPASASDIVNGKEAIDSNGQVITGTIPSRSTDDLTISGPVVNVPYGYYSDSVYKPVTVVNVATPEITVSDEGVVTAELVQSQGWTPGGSKTATKQLTTQVATTYTPTTSDQTIAVGTYCSGVQTIKGDANLVAANIAEGVSIFGVTGTHSGGSGGGSVETCTVILSCTSPIDGYGYTSVVDGIITPVYERRTNLNQITLSNVLCGSLISVEENSISMVGSATVSGEGSFLGWNFPNFYFAAPNTAGATTTFIIYDDD